VRILKDELALAPSRVARGVALLDERDPGWWREDHPRRIVLAKLDMTSICDCIVGQRRGDYLPELEGAPGLLGGAEHGFDMPSAWNFDTSEVTARNAYYAAIQQEWTRVIAERRGAEIQLT
jgi:hypothetical protein